MKPQIATTIEQSRRLLSCGVDPKTADMYWCSFLQCEPFLALGEIPRDNETGNVLDDKDVPAWSLSTLLALLPNLIMAENRMQFTFRLIKCKDAYIVEYEGHGTSLYQTNGATAIEACVRMIETLTFHKHSLNKIEE